MRTKQKWVRFLWRDARICGVLLLWNLTVRLRRAAKRNIKQKPTNKFWEWIKEVSVVQTKQCLNVSWRTSGWTSGIIIVSLCAQFHFSRLWYLMLQVIVAKKEVRSTSLFFVLFWFTVGRTDCTVSCTCVDLQRPGIEVNRMSRSCRARHWSQ